MKTLTQRYWKMKQIQQKKLMLAFDMGILAESQSNLQHTLEDLFKVCTSKDKYENKRENETNDNTQRHKKIT